MGLWCRLPTTATSWPAPGRVCGRLLWVCGAQTKKGAPMLWLILGIILLVIAIAGGVIIHPILFVIAILALVMFLMRTRYA
jgi:hypothetical protein